MVSVTKAFCLAENVENISLSICVECNREIFCSIVFLQSSEYRRRLHRYTYFCCFLARKETNIKPVKRSHNPKWIALDRVCHVLSNLIALIIKIQCDLRQIFEIVPFTRKLRALEL